MFAANRSLITRVVLNNFMSHAQSEVPLGPGLNIITGPNGSGKSAILLGISTALGHSRTERARTLSRLVREGEEEAVVSVFLRNTGKCRPFPNIRKEEVEVTRLIRANGTYRYYIDGRPARREQVLKALARIGFNPANPVIIMHQLMVETFASLKPQEKLRLFEDALGFSEYRSALLSAYHQLQQLHRERGTLVRQLEEIDKVVTRWRDAVRQYQRKLQLEQRLRELKAELAWIKVQRLRRRLQRLVERLERSRSQLIDLEDRIRTGEREIEDARDALYRAKQILEAAIDDLLSASNQFSYQKGVLDTFQQAGKRPRDLSLRLEEASRAVEQARKTLTDAKNVFWDTVDRYVSARIGVEVDRFRYKLLKEHLEQIEEDLVDAREELEAVKAEAARLGPEPPTLRSSREVREELRRIEHELEPLASLSSEVFRYLEESEARRADLEAKIRKLEENRELLLEEVRERWSVWAKVLQEKLTVANRNYNQYLNRLGGYGEIRLINADDPLNAGLQILAGFGGRELTPLEDFTQSGGERTATLVSFLLAIQELVPSPFRAIDEYDVHLDPSKRSFFASLIVEILRYTPIQYIIITPSYVEVTDPTVNVLVVQKVADQSVVGRPSSQPTSQPLVVRS